MPPLALVAFVIASGFAAAGLAASLQAMGTGRAADFRLPRSGLMAAAATFAVVAFTGPYIVAQASVQAWRERRLPIPILCAALAIVMVWSFFSGVLVVQLAAAAGLLGLPVTG